MSMYNLTRQEVAEQLNISTRSVDRYIKSWKLRAKKEWKVVYVHNADVDTLLWKWEKKQEVIVEKNLHQNQTHQKTVSKSTENVSGTLWAIYKDLKEEIDKKDQLIQTLAMRVGKAEEVAKNSVSLLDFKKSQYLLEESKESLSKDLVDLEKKNEKLESELRYEKKTVMYLTLFVLILFVTAWLLWVNQI